MRALLHRVLCLRHGALLTGWAMEAMEATGQALEQALEQGSGAMGDTQVCLASPPCVCRTPRTSSL